MVQSMYAGFVECACCAYGCVEGQLQQKQQQEVCGLARCVMRAVMVWQLVEVQPRSLCSGCRFF
jgi:hypothetical protein